MRRAFTLIALLLAVVVVLALVGPSLPEGNPIRAVGESLRDVGRNVADGFGGGYGKLPAS